MNRTYVSSIFRSESLVFCSQNNKLAVEKVDER
ncbi:MAG: hypothetical protein UX37_C0027G0016 [Microgenomates group bacterium GW2011_GWA2_46_16]|nr:MAG: hypothetical protein UX37_C0027G0016 [Microgenomates group bacterium GW2011_GWA2_46_16]